MYTENDFGMPFLDLLNADGGSEKIAEIIDKLEALQLAIAIDSPSAELEIATELTNDFTKTEDTPLQYKGIVKSVSSNDPPTM